MERPETLEVSGLFVRPPRYRIGHHERALLFAVETLECRREVTRCLRVGDPFGARNPNKTPARNLCLSLQGAGRPDWEKPYFIRPLGRPARFR